jgi:hypothetical protein
MFAKIPEINELFFLAVGNEHYGNKKQLGT